MGDLLEIVHIVFVIIINFVTKFDSRRIRTSLYMYPWDRQMSCTVEKKIGNLSDGTYVNCGWEEIDPSRIFLKKTLSILGVFFSCFYFFYICLLLVDTYLFLFLLPFGIILAFFPLILWLVHFSSFVLFYQSSIFGSTKGIMSSCPRWQALLSHVSIQFVELLFLFTSVISLSVR